MRLVAGKEGNGICGQWEGGGLRVVAPSLTPESYNFRAAVLERITVVAPSLTPESYNPKQKTPCFYKEFFVLDYAKMAFSEQ